MRCVRGLSCISIGNSPQAVLHWKPFSKSTETSAVAPQPSLLPGAAPGQGGHSRCSRRMGRAAPGHFGAPSDLNAERQLVSRSILGCAWIPGVCEHRAGGWAPGRVSPTSLSPRGLYLAKEEAPVPSLGCVWELPEGHSPIPGLGWWHQALERQQDRRSGRAEAPRASPLTQTRHWVLAEHQAPTNLSSNSTEAPKSSSPPPKLHPHVRGSPGPQPGPCPVRPTRECCSRGAEAPGEPDCQDTSARGA